MSRKSPRLISGAETRAKALELRKQGLSFAAIAKRLGKHKSTIGEHVSRALREIIESSHADAETVRQLELERLDALLVALGARIKKHDVKAIEAAVKIGQARARLHGLDKQQVEVSGTGGLTIFLPAEEPAPEQAATAPSPTTEGAVGSG
jgi:IS30 family transposase